MFRFKHHPRHRVVKDVSGQAPARRSRPRRPEAARRRDIFLRRRRTPAETPAERRDLAQLCRFAGECPAYRDRLVPQADKGPGGRGCTDSTDAYRSEHCRAFACMALTEAFVRAVRQSPALSPSLQGPKAGDPPELPG